MMAGMWAYRARDGLATAMHGMWGSFWMAYGLLSLLFAVGTLAEPKPAFVELGYWFIVLAVITWVGTVAALAENGILAGCARLSGGWFHVDGHRSVHRRDVLAEPGRLVIRCLGGPGDVSRERDDARGVLQASDSAAG